MPGNTAQELVDLAGTLNDFAVSIDDYIDDQPDRYSDHYMGLRANEGQIATAAATVAGLAMSDLAPDIAAATVDLTRKVNSARQTLQDIETAQKAVALIAGVLAVAASAATGNPFAAASGVAGLAGQVEKLLG